MQDSTLSLSIVVNRMEELINKGKYKKNENDPSFFNIILDFIFTPDCIIRNFLLS